MGLSGQSPPGPLMKTKKNTNTEDEDCEEKKMLPDRSIFCFPPAHLFTGWPQREICVLPQVADKFFFHPHHQSLSIDSFVFGPLSVIVTGWRNFIVRYGGQGLRTERK